MKIFHYDPTELKFKKVPYTLLLIVLAAVLMFTTLISYGMSRTIYETVVITQETGMLVLREQNKFSEEAFDVYINSLNMKFPEIVKAQAILESSNFSSEIFKANNNMFGMKAASIRPTTNIGTNLGHANFNTWRDCVLDYAFYYASYLREVKTKEQYYEYLGNNYAEDPNYVSKLKSIVAKNKID
tara:strand:- start:1996 stop:2550 length:555 start_codon:yes stop_codon:yes gene_type:complete